MCEILGYMKELYSRVQHLGERNELEEYKKSNSKI